VRPFLSNVNMKLEGCVRPPYAADLPSNCPPWPAAVAPEQYQPSLRATTLHSEGPGERSPEGCAASAEALRLQVHCTRPASDGCDAGWRMQKSQYRTGDVCAVLGISSDLLRWRFLTGKYSEVRRARGRLFTLDDLEAILAQTKNLCNQRGATEENQVQRF
jgi:hypothetical protein